MTTTATEQTLKDEIARLKSQLSATQAQLTSNAAPPHPTDSHVTLPSHPLLLLSDSALPLGSFAFSSGLESYLAHHRPHGKGQVSSDALPHFLTLSLTSLATTTLPYLIAAYKEPSRLLELDETLDACTLCPVARRASVAQGTALITLWDRALKGEAVAREPRQALIDFSVRMKRLASQTGDDDDTAQASGHFAPIWAVVTLAMGISLREAAYVFLLNHAKAVISAAVRASVLGPYAAQGVLASSWLRGEIERIMDYCWETDIVEAGQGVPMCDLWVGRHELLYSRIFNS